MTVKETGVSRETGCDNCYCCHQILVNYCQGVKQTIDKLINCLYSLQFSSSSTIKKGLFINVVIFYGLLNGGLEYVLSVCLFLCEQFQKVEQLYAL